ncbi:MAG: asparagine synthase (glutamine-hydrolyzing), partial [Candidatus Eiseniibacteriota bacterium]
MCGISGVFHYRGGIADRSLIGRQLQGLRHRGPDDAGLWSDGDVAFGHRRLSIVDLSPGGHQPMANEDESIWVTYNGELYDWPVQRPVLEALGHRFRGNADTESLLHLYEEHGTAMFEQLRGFFAFGLFDRNQRRLLLGRDRFGVKPLYYHDDGKRISFASELKALVLDPSVPNELDECAVADYLTFQYVPGPRTIWKGVRKLPPAHYLVADAQGVRIARYWSLPCDEDAGHSVEHYRERLLELLADAVKVRLLSDVPLGAFLSGGVDSSVVVAMMARAMSEPVKTFSIGFEQEDFSELEHARTVARHLGTDHHELVVQPRALDLLPRLVWQMDEPFADASMIPSYYVSQMARRHVTVALSGDGGDEMHAGYSTYAWASEYARLDFLPRSLRRLAAMPARILHSDHPLGRKLGRLGMDVVERHLDVMSTFRRPEWESVLSSEMRERLRGHDPYQGMREVQAAGSGRGAIPSLLHLDAHTYMIDDVMVKVDRTSMMNSLEAREPLLDHKLVEFVARVPFQYKLNGQVGKWLLRDSVRDLLPAGILARGKQGFGVPLDHWFGTGFGRLARDVLFASRPRWRGIFDPRGV